MNNSLLELGYLLNVLDLSVTERLEILSDVVSKKDINELFFEICEISKVLCQ